MKVCSKCKNVKNEDQFRKDPRYAKGLFCWCWECSRAYSRSPKKLALDRARRKEQFADPAFRAAYNEKQRLEYLTPKGKRRRKNEMYRRKYGITLEFFESEEKKQKGCCKLCGRKRRLVVDHDHKTGRYRGIICGLCNVALGRIESVPNFISKIQEYLK